MKKLFLILLVISFLFPTSSSGASNLILTQDWKKVSCVVEQWTVYYFGAEHLNDPCPSSNVVNNPTEYPWDIDDAWSLQGTGNLATGSISTTSFYRITDNTHKAEVNATVRAKHNKLLVKLTASDGRSWIAAPIKQGSDYVYNMCGDNYIGGILPVNLPLVENSNGGHGVIVQYTLTIDATQRGGNGIFALLKSGQGIWSIGVCE